MMKSHYFFVGEILGKWTYLPQFPKAEMFPFPLNFQEKLVHSAVKQCPRSSPRCDNKLITIGREFRSLCLYFDIAIQFNK